MPEYRAVRARLGFLALCKSPDAAAEVTVTAALRLGVDAAIVFADILLVLEPMGVGLEFTRGDGPVIRRPVRSGADVDRLTEVDPAALGYVAEAVKRSRAALPARVPVIGFAGAPFTLASYLVEGGGSRTYARTKALMATDPGAWRALMERLVCVVAAYLNAQIAAGADAVQLFDSWVGCLSPADYRAQVLPHVRALIGRVTPGTPVIHFGTGTAGLLEAMRAAGGDVIGLDWRVDLDAAWARLGPRHPARDPGRSRARAGRRRPRAVGAVACPRMGCCCSPSAGRRVRRRYVPSSRTCCAGGSAPFPPAESTKWSVTTRRSAAARR